MGKRGEGEMQEWFWSTMRGVSLQSPLRGDGERGRRERAIQRFTALMSLGRKRSFVNPPSFFTLISTE